MYENWNDVDRDELNAEDLLKDFGLPLRHEFVITLIDKLIKDGHAALIQPHNAAGMSMIDIYQRNSIITVDGYYFVQQGKRYRSRKKKQLAKEFLKTYGGIIVGAAALIWNIIKELSILRSGICFLLLK